MTRETGLTMATILAWVGETSLSRGGPYVDRLLDQRRTGPELKARCVGSAAQPYRVTSTLTASGGIAASTCSCPIGGRCKHVAALLLAWLAEPDAFLEVEPLDIALERRDKAELIALIRQMLARHPELETLLELPLPTASGKRKPAGYDELRKLAQGEWAKLRGSLLRGLQAENKHVLLTEIALRESDVAGALAALARLKGAFAASGGEPLHIRVARAAEKSHPREALAIYRTAAQKLITFQGRENYRVAAGYLKKCGRCTSGSARSSSGTHSSPGCARSTSACAPSARSSTGPGCSTQGREASSPFDLERAPLDRPAGFNSDWGGKGLAQGQPQEAQVARQGWIAARASMPPTGGRV